MNAKIPTKIGRYEVDRMLGQGAMGSVYLGRDPQLDRRVAIKTVRDLDLDEKHLKSFLERFRNEARAAARLSHPSIVGVYDVGEEEGIGPFLVFEYVPGSTLKQIMRARGPLDPEEAVHIAMQIADAIDTAHLAGIIHRDVKPDNILIAEDSRAKLADFGVARVPDAALTKEGQFLGTPCYAAPETLAGGRYSPQSDVFSFAAVVYELVANVRAFPGDDAISVAHSVVHDEPIPPSEAANHKVPKRIDAVVLKGLAKEASERWVSARDMAENLEAAYVAAGLLEAGPPPTGRVQLPAGDAFGAGSGRTSAWAFGAVMAVALGVGIALVVGLGGGAGGASELDADAGVLPDDPSLDAGLRPAFRDAGAALVEILDAGPSDSGPPDTGAPDTGAAAMSDFEREELAKDEVESAQEHLAAGRVDAAATALERARRLDPENSDLDDLEDAIGAARSH